jgi:hypothetical protein
MALAEINTVGGVVVDWLVHTGCGRGIGAFIDSRLHLIEEIVNIEQIALGP